MSSKRMKKIQKLSPTPELVFSISDLESVILGHDDPMIILEVTVNAEVKRVFVDQGSSVDFILQDTFNKLELKNSDL